MKTALLFITVFVALSECKKHSNSNNPVTEVELGTFQNSQHGVRGQVYKADNSTINIKYFDYDGAGKLNKDFNQLIHMRNVVFGIIGKILNKDSL